MHYDALKNDHGLPFNPIKGLVVPRPIGWVSSRSASGRLNLAPYSFFNLVSSNPDFVVLGSSGRKDSMRNIEETGEFVCNLATWDLRRAMNQTSAAYPHGVDEMEKVGLTPAPSRFVQPPRVKESPAALECRHHQTLTLPGPEGAAESENFLLIGKVVGVYIDDAVIENGRVVASRLRPLARLGYMDYAVIEKVFEMARPQLTE